LMKNNKIFFIKPLKMNLTDGTKRQQNLIWRRGNTQNKTYKIQNTAKIWNPK
jgi:hypothetical protein